MPRRVPEGRPRIDGDPGDVGCTEKYERGGQQNSVSHRNSGVDNSRSMLRSRDDVYQPGLPAKAGEHYRAFVRFAARHAGERVLDLGCGYGAYSLALQSEGRQCVGCDINIEYLKAAASAGLPVVAAQGSLPFPDKSFDTVLLFEVIEHVPQIEALLGEAFRLARKNVLVTVPNAEDLELLK